ncbi:MAG: helix-hairpin-helix domain-containing protein [Kofleriaceae bacterium]
MTDLALIDLVGFWLGIFLTLSILSFLYKDNPFYKLGEHLFIGTSLGYIIITQYDNTLEPKLLGKLGHDAWKLVPLVMVLALLVRVFSRQWAWVGRYPLAFVIALYAGLQINAMAESELAVQIKRSAQSVESTKIDLNSAPMAGLRALPGVTPAIADKWVAERAQRPFASVDDAVSRGSLTAVERENLEVERGSLVGLDAKAGVTPAEIDYFGVVSNVLLLLGMLASLLYFYFSMAHKGVVGRVSRFGVWTLMIGFGASFGYTVQGRIALAIGRAQDVMGTFRPPRHAEQIQGPLVALISAAIIVVGLVVWERRGRRTGAA